MTCRRLPRDRLPIGTKVRPIQDVVGAAHSESPVQPDTLSMARLTYHGTIRAYH